MPTRMCDMSKSLAESNKHVRVRSSKLGETGTWVPDHIAESTARPSLLKCVCFPTSLRLLVEDP